MEPVATQVISLYESRSKIQPRSVKGVFSNWRWVMVWLTQIVFYGLPWIKWADRQAVLFALEARRFYIFGLVLYPQDFIYLTGLLVASALSLFLFTAVAGRLWCGYACPQTVYTEIFIWIESVIEGDRSSRLRLDRVGWSFDKIWKRFLKHFVWLAFGMWTGLTFVGYFTPIRDLLAEIHAFTLGPWELFWVLFYGFATYGNAGFLREQICKYMCPYARFQGVMFDSSTLIVAYNEARGEPRGKRSKGVNPSNLSLGDCVDCTICVQVCPTGIDIRNGLQYECIGCGACIDACDSVMDQVGYPRGLVSYSTSAKFEERSGKFSFIRLLLRPRVIIYASALLVLLGVLAVGLCLRVPLKVDVMRDRAVLFRALDDGGVSNVYTLQLMNAQEKQTEYRVDVYGLPTAKILSAKRIITLGPAEAQVFPIEIGVSLGAVPSGMHNIEIVVTSTRDASVSVMDKEKFYVP